TGDGSTCIDVDECAADADPSYGGCFRDAVARVATTCTNVAASPEAPEGRVCGPCPDGYKGSGETGCVQVPSCATSNGGCWMGSGEYSEFSTTCTDMPGTGGTECGACPSGFSGTGDTGCVDTDGCVLEPCFPGVTCTDVRPPGEGRLCEYEGPEATVPWSCPEGFHGDGAQCTQCQLAVQIIDSTAQSGVETRAGWHKGRRAQLTGQLDGLDHPNCTNQEGTHFVWEGASSDGASMVLTPESNKANTLRLSIPKRDLQVGLSYQLALRAYMAGAPTVRDAATSWFFVETQPLVAVINGGGVVTGSSNTLELSAADSVDPDGEPGLFTCAWVCSRTDGTDVCRDNKGTALPSMMYNTSLALTLLGGASGVNYTFVVHISKGSRQSSADTWLTIFDSPSPVVTMEPHVEKVGRPAQPHMAAVGGV
ncbi:hypothetical protein CYMTET_19790, partial [Cymbomonas tetramitiformis]